MNGIVDLTSSPPPLRHDELWRIYLSIIVMFYGAFLAATSMLVPDAGSLVLDDEGFWIKGCLDKKHRKMWVETSNFRTEPHAAFWTAVIYDNAAQTRSKVGIILTALCPPGSLVRRQTSVLKDVYDLTPETLALLMTQWRERALQH
jgi:hypothetical protein